MSRISPRTMLFLFGFLSIAAVAVFLMLYQGSPGPLAAPHADVIRGSTIFSCRKCHSEEGLMPGCLHCHSEIAEQLDSDTGYHAYLMKEEPVSCEACHAEHLGADFLLVNAASWTDTDTNAFNHPHVEFRLKGKHDELGCKKCHEEKRSEPFALPEFPKHPRVSTMLGLNQECIRCHQDVHESGEKTRDCTHCHDQNAFKPAPFFDHSKHFVLEGHHAKATCSACHQTDAPPEMMKDDAGERVLKFGPVKGKQCADCHESPHRFEPQLQGDCMRCHKGTDEKWLMGERGVDVAFHDNFGFVLQGAHAKVECSKCHSPKLETYAARFPDPAVPGYSRLADQCSGCHRDPHDGQFKEQYPTCAQCHTVERFKPSTLGPVEHPEKYPLKGGHMAVACNQCHAIPEGTEVRQFKGTATACRACHENPHGQQFDKEIARNDCSACHVSDFSTFRIREYKHQDVRPFFMGKGHSQAACVQCHVPPARSDAILQYRDTPTQCSACHMDIHRGQFRQSGYPDCERCHTAFDTWRANEFDHEQDSEFKLGKAHREVDCGKCHQPVPQQDGHAVVQYRPLTRKCEDCHGFQNK